MLATTKHFSSDRGAPRRPAPKPFARTAIYGNPLQSTACRRITRGTIGDVVGTVPSIARGPMLDHATGRRLSKCSARQVFKRSVGLSMAETHRQAVDANGARTTTLDGRDRFAAQGAVVRPRGRHDPRLGRRKPALFVERARRDAFDFARAESHPRRRDQRRRQPDRATWSRPTTPASCS